MSLALKCDFCKNFFAFKDETLPNIATFGHIYESKGAVKIRACYYIPPDIIEKNAYNINGGAYTFIICNKCMKRIMNLIIEEEENNDNT